MKYDFNDWLDTEQYMVKGFNILDLSVSIMEHSEVPGEKGYSDPDVCFETRPWTTLDVKPYYITKIVMGAHVGTHIDAPSHVKENGKRIDDIPNEFVGQAVVIDVNSQLDDERLKKSLNKIKRNSILVIRGKTNYGISDDYRKLIIRSQPQIVIFGDCVNVDGVEDTLQYLESDIPMVMGANENALSALKDDDLIFVMPIKFKGIEAAPVRLFALQLDLEANSYQETDIDFTLED